MKSHEGPWRIIIDYVRITIGVVRPKCWLILLGDVKVSSPGMHNIWADEATRLCCKRASIVDIHFLKVSAR